MDSFFSFHLYDALLIYAVGHLMLASVSAIAPRHDAGLPFMRDIWLISVYGLLRGTHVLALLRLAVPPETAALPPWLNSAWMLVSFLMFFEFGRRVMRTAAPAAIARRPWLLGPIPLYGLIAAVLGLLSLGTADGASGLQLGALYLVSLPAGVLTAAGMIILVRRAPAGAAPGSVRLWLWVMALVALCYGLLAPFRLDSNPILPAWLPTAQEFQAATGLPSLLPRALVMVAMLIGLIGMIYGSNTRAERLEEALRRSEMRLRAVLRITRLGAWEWNIATGEVSWTNEMYTIFGHDRASFVPTRETYSSAVVPDDRDRERGSLEQALASKTRGHTEQEIRIRRPDGTVRSVRTVREIERAADGTALRMVGSVMDITESSVAEEELFEQRDLLRAVFDALPVWVSVKNRDLRYLMVNRQTLTDTGMMPEQFLGVTMDELRIGPEAVKEIHAAADRRILSGVNGQTAYEVEQNVANGRLAVMSVIKAPFHDARGDIAGVVTVTEDITARKRAEEERRLSQARFVEAQRIAQVGSWDLDLVQGSLVWSDEIFHIFEIDKSRFGATYEAFLDAIHPEDRDAVNTAYTRSLETREPYEIVHRLRMADGRIKHVHERCETHFDPSGKALRSLGTVQDITARVLVETALRDTQRRQQSILDSMFAFVGLFDLDGVLVDVNRAPLEAGGVRREDALGKPFWETYWLAHSPATQEQIRAAFGRVAGGEIVREDVAVRMAGGAVMTFDATFSPILDADGRVVQIVGSGVDVSDRILAQQALQESQGRLEEAQRIAHVGSWEWDAATETPHWSKELCAILEVDPDRPVPTVQEQAKIYAAESMQAMNAAIERAFDTGAPYEIELERVREGAPSKWLLARGEVRRGADGKIAGLRGTALDVTERKRAEQENLAHRRRMESVLGSISDGFFSLNNDWIYTYVNENAAKFVGKTPGELLNNCIWDVFPDAKNSSWHQRYQEVMDSRQPLQFEDYYAHLDAWYAGAVYPFEDGISIYFRDVTEQKRAADRIAAQLLEKEVLLREIHHRVKNNLQVVSSLLYLQQQQARRPEDAEVLRESRNRVAAMALVHEKLYSSTELTHVDLVDYARDLANSLLTSFGVDPGRILLRVEGDSVQLPLDRAISCGLLINELVSNSLKHAFPGDRSGEFSLSVAERDGGYELIIRDDGIGFETKEQEPRKGALGLRLIPRLADQLNGTIERMEGPGTGYRLMMAKEAHA